MSKRISTLLIAALALAAIGGTTSVATAKQGADDPAADVRQGQGADDPAADIRHAGADDTTKVAHKHATRHHRSHHRARHARGADDRAGHTRQGKRIDDGPNHS